MKDNTLVLKNSSGEKQEYRILLDIEDTTNNVNYVNNSLKNKVKIDFN